MDELLADLKKQSEKESTENSKSLFTSINGIENEMQQYEEWVRATKADMLASKDQSLQPKSADIELKPQAV